MVNVVHAFATLAWEVRTTPVASPGKPQDETGFVARFSLGNFSLERVPSQRFIQC